MQLIIAGVLTLFFTIPSIPNLINPVRFYKVDNNKVFFGNKEMLGVAPNKFESISNNVAKGATKIYFRGEEVDVDYETFGVIMEGFIYIDKDYTYYETKLLFSKNKLAILEGDYDKKTFKNIENTLLFRDKNHLYELDPVTLNLEIQQQVDGLNIKHWRLCK